MKKGRRKGSRIESRELVVVGKEGGGKGKENLRGKTDGTQSYRWVWPGCDVPFVQTRRVAIGLYFEVIGCP